jgi:hypothetical protein
MHDTGTNILPVAGYPISFTTPQQLGIYMSVFLGLSFTWPCYSLAFPFPGESLCT